MYILVLVKEVVSLAGFSGRDHISRYVDSSDVTLKINPYDIQAILIALKIKEKYPEKVKIDCLSLCNLASQKNLKSLYGLGVDNVYILEYFPANDPIVKASILSTFVAFLNPDIVLAGKQSIDTGHHLVPCWISHNIGLPFVDAAEDVELVPEMRKALITKEDHKGYQDIYEVDLPAICAVDIKNDVNFSLPGLKRIEAMKKEIKILRIQNLKVEGKILSISCYFPRPKPKPLYAPSASLSSFERMMALLSGTKSHKRATRVKTDTEGATIEIINFLKDKRII
ncbi:MAG: hypothetical protein ABIM30_03235 [candidate division WOR-3 bacterium]